MLETLGTILPNAIAIAMSPVPIIAVILMLMSSRGSRLGGVFLAGWVLGVAVAVTAFSLATGLIPERTTGDSQPVMGVILVVLGLGLLALGIKQWRGRPKAGEQADLPAWMAKISDMRLGAAFVLAVALAALNPKNLLLTAAAGTEIGRANLGAGLAVVITTFTLLASLTVLLPVLFAVFAPKAAAATLDSIRIWLTANNAVIMVVLFVVLGTKVLGNGLAAF